MGVPLTSQTNGMPLTVFSTRERMRLNVKSESYIYFIRHYCQRNFTFEKPNDFESYAAVNLIQFIFIFTLYLSASSLSITFDLKYTLILILLHSHYKLKSYRICFFFLQEQHFSRGSHCSNLNLKFQFGK